MAITEAQPNLKAQVFVNGVALREHENDEDEDTPTVVTKYIEATAGALFEVRYQFNYEFAVQHSILATIHVDGKYADGHVLDDKWRHWIGPAQIMAGTREMIGVKCFERKFQFSQLNRVDGDLSKVGDALMKKLKDVGSITLKLEWISVDGPSASQHSRGHDVSEIDSVPEKALKGRAISNQVGLGDRKATPSFKYINTTKLFGKPFATFVFKYRSRGDLQSLLIIPRSPSPVPLEERDINTLSLEETRELLKRQKEREEAARKVKVEGVKRERTRERSSTILSGDDGDDDDEVSVVSSKRRKFAISVDGAGAETIDLT